MCTEEPLSGIVAGVVRLPENAAAHVGGAVPHQLGKVSDALANAKM